MKVSLRAKTSSIFLASWWHKVFWRFTQLWRVCAITQYIDPHGLARKNIVWSATMLLTQWVQHAFTVDSQHPWKVHTTFGIDCPLWCLAFKTAFCHASTIANTNTCTQLSHWLLLIQNRQLIIDLVVRNACPHSSTLYCIRDPEIFLHSGHYALFGSREADH